MGKVMRHTHGASLNIRHNLSSSKRPKPLQLKLLTTYIPKTSAFTLAFSTSQRLRTTRASARDRRASLGKERRWGWGARAPEGGRAEGRTRRESGAARAQHHRRLLPRGRARDQGARAPEGGRAEGRTRRAPRESG